MASTVTRLADVIVPERYGRYLTEASIYKNAFMQSGILASNAKMKEFLGGGGTLYNLPHFQRPSTDPTATYSNKTIETQKITTSRMAFRRLMFDAGFSDEDLASALSGENVTAAIEGMTDDYWNTFMNKIIFSTVKGIMADNIENDSSSLVHNITTPGTPSSSNKISTSAVVATKKKLGDRMDEFSAVAMHSEVYSTLLNNDAISTYLPSGRTVPIELYGKLRVIVDDGLVPDTDGSNSVYWTIFFKYGSILFDESSQGIVPVELYRNAPKSETALYTRRQFGMHPFGYRWLETSVASDMPTKSELEESGNWDRTYDVKNTGIVVLKSNG